MESDLCMCNYLVKAKEGENKRKQPYHIQKLGNRTNFDIFKKWSSDHNAVVKMKSCANIFERWMPELQQTENLENRSKNETVHNKW